MGMFDYLTYQGHEYQTKDTPNQWLDRYKLEQDQTSGHWYLWLEEYECEWIEDPDHWLKGYLRQYNQHWVKCKDVTETIRFYREGERGYKNNDWIEWEAVVVDGQMMSIRPVYEDRFMTWYAEGLQEKGLE